jgi:hypothetical protein
VPRGRRGSNCPNCFGPALLSYTNTQMSKQSSDAPIIGIGIGTDKLTGFLHIVIEFANRFPITINRYR